MHGYLSLDIMCSSMLTVIRSRKTVRFSEQMMSADKYPCIHIFARNGNYCLYNDRICYAKHDSRLAAYGGIVLQRFEFIKLCKGTQRLCWKSHLFLYFVNKVYLACCRVYCLLFASSSRCSIAISVSHRFGGFHC